MFPIFNGMINLMVAKFMMNDIPHAAGLVGSSRQHIPIRTQRLTVDMIIDDLERAWHSMDPEMQESINILKDTMGHYYMEPCIAAWDNGNLIGVLVYDVFGDKDAGIKITHIAQLASFTQTPGIGSALVSEVIKIGLGNESDIISVDHGLGARGFYEKLGFIQNKYEYQVPESMMYKLSRRAG